MFGRGENLMSLPMRGEWIEIPPPTGWPNASTGSLPMRGEWIEIKSEKFNGRGHESLPMRGEWIEMSFAFSSSIFFWVSPHAGRVD